LTNQRLSGKVAIVTGATGGIGEATAKLFLEEGARVMLVGRSAKKLKETRERLAAYQELADFVAEATDEDATAASVAATLKAFGGVDILFANAGYLGSFRPMKDTTFSEFEKVLRTNVLGVWLSMKYCVEPMKQRGGGSIIATASISGVVGFAGFCPYVASKHAVCGLVKAAALEQAEAGIRVNAIAPGAIDNQMLRSLVAGVNPDAPEAVSEVLVSQVPMKRLGTNEEVARLALFLASSESSFCTGGTYLIDGGYVTA
jgi:NAD(P)-dependent dehydrogenase (short-subunit alcohol dehydrogenase family)